jgi:hypothetical protein
MAANVRRRVARGVVSGDVRTLQGHVAELEQRLAAQMEERLAAQRAELEGRLASQEAQLAAQQEEIARLRAQQAEASGSPLTLPARLHGLGASDAGGERPEGATGRSSSRRGLLKLGGAAAAAGVAAGLVGRAQAAHAAPVPTGGNFILGQSNDANVTTSLGATIGSQPSPLLDVKAYSSTTGIHGFADGFGGVAVRGDGVNGAIGVLGSSDSQNGVQAYSTDSDALFASGGRYGAALAGGAAPLYLGTQSFAGAPNSGQHNAGEMLIDLNGNMWICVHGNGSDAGEWRRVSAPQVGYAGGALNLLPVPIRLLDTRANVSDAYTHPGAPVGYQQTLSFPAANLTYLGQTIPYGATAVFGLLTAALDTPSAVNCGDGSSAICWATGTKRPVAVNVLYNPQDLKGAYTANFTVVAIGAPNGSGQGQVSLYSQPINIQPTPQVAVDYLFDCFGFVM